MPVQVSYKGSQLTSFANTTKTLRTSGKYLEGDVSITETISLQDKSFTPAETSAVVSADSGYDGLSTVTVAGISSDYVGSAVAKLSSADLTVSGSTVTAPSGFYSQDASASVAAGSAFTPATTITTNPSITVDASGLVTATVSNYRNITPTVNEGYIVSGTSGRVQASGSSTYQLSTQGASTITPTETQQTAVSSGTFTTGNVVVAGISSDYVGTAVTRRSSADLTASGATVTVPAGFYSAQAQTAVATATHPNPSVSINSSTGLVTASHTQSAGYVTAGTTSATLQLTIQAASTITPSTVAQTAVASGVFTTGVVTVDAIPSNYVDSSTLKTYYTGTSAPSSSLGNNGDLYFQTSDQ